MAGREGAKGHRKRGITPPPSPQLRSDWMLFAEALKRTVTAKEEDNYKHRTCVCVCVWMVSIGSSFV